MALMATYPRHGYTLDIQAVRPALLRGTENADERGVRGANDAFGETDRTVGDVSRAVGKVPD